MEDVKRLMELEKEYLPKLKHPNIIELWGFSENDTQGCLIYPKIGNETLRDRLKEKKLSANQRLKIMIGIAKGIDYIHKFHTQVNM